MNKNTFKSIGAVLAGILIPAILATITDTILEKTGVFPSIEHQQQYGFNVVWMNLLALFYRFGFSVLGGFVTAKLAPSKPMRHIVILGIIATVVGIISNIAVASMPETANVLPVWFSVVMILMAFPSIWLGGKLALKK
jgi:hypothetical protein